MGKGEIALHLETWGWPGPEGAGASSQKVGNADMMWEMNVLLILNLRREDNGNGRH